MIHSNNESRLQSDSYLKEHAGIYRSMFENSHATILLIDPADGSIVDANPAACTFYGWSREQLLKMRINQINMASPEMDIVAQAIVLHDQRKQIT